MRKLFNIFKPHIVKFNDGYFAVRRYSPFDGWVFLCASGEWLEQDELSKAYSEVKAPLPVIQARLAEPPKFDIGELWLS